MPTSGRTLILGIGNLLMADEGVGIHAARILEAAELPASVDVIDGGTGGFHLLSLFETYPRIIIIDATMDGKPAGSLTLLKPRFSSDYPRTLTAHDIGLRDLVETAELLGYSPAVSLITVSISDVKSMIAELSPAVESSLSAIVEIVSQILTEDKSVVSDPP